jgi:hypothetical protein
MRILGVKSKVLFISSFILPPSAFILLNTLPNHQIAGLKIRVSGISPGLREKPACCHTR